MFSLDLDAAMKLLDDYYNGKLFKENRTYTNVIETDKNVTWQRMEGPYGKLGTREVMREKGRQNNEAVYKSNLYSNAVQFMDAGKILFKLNLIYPATVTMALSCELFLKFMIEVKHSQNGEIIQEKTHSLNKLFDKLPENKKKILETAISKRVDISIFKEDLKKYSNIFTELRYFHEFKSTSIIPTIIINFAESLHEVCMQ